LEETPGTEKNILSEDQTTALIREIAGGNSSALAELYKQTGKPVYGLILKILNNRSAAEKVTLDVYTHVWKEAPVYDPNRRPPLLWLIGTARRLALAGLQPSHEKTVAPPPPAASGDRDAAGTAKSDTALSAWDSLPARQRRLLDLLCYRGLTCREISSRFQQPLPAVKRDARLGLLALSKSIRSESAGR
jgi:RNA polymerase sigma-70 factor (ECF subfamily)